MSMNTVLITGAGRGLGLAAILEFYDKGWQVFPLVRNPESLSKFADLDPAQCVPIVCDVDKDQTVQAISETLSRHASCLDVLINNAGIGGTAWELSKVEPEEVEALLSTHCLGALRCTQGAEPWLLKSQSPVVLNISSRFGSFSRVAECRNKEIRVSYSYRIAKAAQNMFTACLAQELGPKGAVVCALHPGTLQTALASPGADTTAHTAAQALYGFVENLDASMNAGYFDLISGRRLAG